jgi:sodium/hydrogen exchanger-like protein 6/7
VLDLAPDASQAEISSSWALFIMIMLIIVALFVSYILQLKRIEAVHETVVSIFAGKHYPGTEESEEANLHVQE